MSTNGYLQVTRECNQDCRFCSNPPNENKLTIEQGRGIISEFAENGMRGVIFTGGEPTLSAILPELISFTCEKKLEPRVITNGQKICDPEYFNTLYKAGLRNLHISLYSVNDDVQTFLSGNKDSLNNINSAIKNVSHYPSVQLVINTVINKYNSGHLLKNVVEITRSAPFVRHFVWNNLDPRNSKVLKYPDTVARLNDFQLELHHAVHYLLKSNRTCRVERVPLCYMQEFEHISTETRKIVKAEATTTFFLDEKGLFSQDEFKYGKAPCCTDCFLTSICAGLFEMDISYSSEELYACFVDKDEIINKILHTEKNLRIKNKAGSGS